MRRWPDRRTGRKPIGRALLLSLAGWSSFRIAEAFGVQLDSVRHWRWLFGRDRVAGVRARKVSGCAPVKARAALAVAQAVLSDEQLERPANWTLPHLQAEIERRTGVRHLDLAAQRGGEKKGGFRWRRPRHTLRGRQDAEAVERGGLRLGMLKQQAKAGDITLLFQDESEALYRQRPASR